MKRQYFVDMDGVLVDFIDGIERLYRQPTGSLKKAGTYHLWEALGVSYGQFSHDIKLASIRQEFWRGLQPLPWAHNLAKHFDFKRDAYVLTSPWAGDYPCYAQKVEWCAQLGIGSDRVIPFPHKHLLAAPGRVLVDDLPGHCAQWVEAGGTAFLFPCQHNDMWHAAFEDGQSSLAEMLPALNRLLRTS